MKRCGIGVYVARDDRMAQAARRMAQFASPRLEQADLPAARHVAHALKGAALSVGAKRLGEIASGVQDALDKGDADAAAFMAGLLEPTVAELEETLAALSPPPTAAITREPA